MKRLLLLICLIFAIGCSKSDDGIKVNLEKRGIEFKSFEKYKLNTGEEKEKPLEYLVVQIWKLEGKDFDFEKSSSSDLYKGYLWDNKTGKSYSSIATSIGGFSFDQELLSGKYAIYIIYNLDKNLIESHSTFEVTKGYTYITKYFNNKINKRFAEW